MIPLTRRHFFAALAAPLAPSARSPNLVVLTADGWRGPSLESRGDSYLVAPDLRQLAGQAIDFTRAYAARPVPATGDSPILAGCFPHRRDNTPVLRTALEEMGYLWGDFSTASTGRVAEFIRVNRGKVFAAWCPMRLVERPAARFRYLYDRRPILGRANMPEDRDDPAWKNFPAYYAALSEADAALGSVVSALEETNLSADTILIFTSHCGRMLGSHDLDGEDQFYEESASVPLFLRYPRKFPAGAVVEYPVSLTDLAPTLLALCGADVPAAIHGRNLAPLLLGQTSDQPQSVFVEGKLGTAAAWRMVVRGVNKLVVDHQHQVTALYNIGLDPYELENQATLRTQELIRDEMRVILRDWMSRTGDWAVRPR